VSVWTRRATFTRKPPARNMMTLAPWVGALLTVVAFILHATWSASKIDSAISGQASGLASQGVRIDQVIARAAAEEQRVRVLEERILFLCNERRRDNEEAGRPTTGAPC
jgi:hypothetical protein